jgi:hypothetical protein
MMLVGGRVNPSRFHRHTLFFLHLRELSAASIMGHIESC